VAGGGVGAAASAMSSGTRKLVCGPGTRLFEPPRVARSGVPMSEEKLIVNAGQESVEHAIRAASALDPSALEHRATSRLLVVPRGNPLQQPPPQTPYLTLHALHPTQ